MTTPLTNGQVLGVFAGLEGLAFGLIGSPPATEEPAEEPAESGESGGASGGSGGGGNTTTPAVTAVLPPSTPAQASSAAPQPTTAPVAGKLKLLSHKVKGGVVTVVVEVPAAGKLTVRANNLKSVSRTATRAGRLGIRMSVSRAGAAWLRKHHRLRVKLQASFTPRSGALSSVAITVTLR